ncbi:GerAB/ArcD/ProY family transporter [Pseudalkalibacillus sp. Hm43]|uniref:GerAB/ArcD/ProY family transporter n=1 Tax=Pseudalkalibacillus sp. Hm43 TaxID=3450742 RepID=UPI003F442B1D
MRKVESVGNWQIIILFQAFITGSSILNIQGPLIGIAQNGAWISILIINAFSFLILALILRLHERYPDESYIQYSKKLLGKPLALILGVPFLLLLFHFNANITYGMGQFFTTSMMKETPLYVFHFLILMVAGLTVRSGVEVMARMFNGLLFFVLFIILMIFLLNITHYHPEFLLPVVPDGWKPVIHGAYVGFGFPYMDIMYFAMILPFLKMEKDKPFKRWMYAGLLFNGLILAFTIVASIMILGPIAMSEKFPIYQAARIIEIGEIIQRVESVFGMALIIGSYMKITLMLFIINEVMTQLFNLSDKRAFVFPNALLVFLFSLTMYENEVELGESGSIMETILAFFLAFVPLVIVTIRSLFKRQSS